MYPKMNILTYYKHEFCPSDARPDDIDIRDIAHALSFLCRANGHFSRFFSVGSHCINCYNEASARGLSAEVRLACLIHDASEAFISDITRPVKTALPDYRALEEQLETVISEKFGLVLSDAEKSELREIDDAMLYYEFLEFADEELFATPPFLLIRPDFSDIPFDQTEKKYLLCYEECEALRR